jgi:hypothetical protein
MSPIGPGASLTPPEKKWKDPRSRTSMYSRVQYSTVLYCTVHYISSTALREPSITSRRHDGSMPCHAANAGRNKSRASCDRCQLQRKLTNRLLKKPTSLQYLLHQSPPIISSVKSTDIDIVRVSQSVSHNDHDFNYQPPRRPSGSNFK